MRCGCVTEALRVGVETCGERSSQGKNRSGTTIDSGSLSGYFHNQPPPANRRPWSVRSEPCPQLIGRLHQNVGLQVDIGFDFDRTWRKDPRNVFRTQIIGDRALDPADDQLVQGSGRGSHQQHAVQELVAAPIIREGFEVAQGVAWDDEGHCHKLLARRGGPQTARCESSRQNLLPADDADFADLTSHQSAEAGAELTGYSITTERLVRNRNRRSKTSKTQGSSEGATRRRSRNRKTTKSRLAMVPSSSK